LQKKFSNSLPRPFVFLCSVHPCFPATSKKQRLGGSKKWKTAETLNVRQPTMKKKELEKKRKVGSHPQAADR